MRNKRNKREDFDIYSDDDFDIFAGDSMEEFENDDDFRDADDYEDEAGYDGDYRDDYEDDGYRDDYEDDYAEGFEEGYEDDFKDDFYDFDKENVRSSGKRDRSDDYEEYEDDYPADYEDEDHDDELFEDYEDDGQEDEYMRDYKGSRRKDSRSKRYRDDYDDEEYYEDSRSARRSGKRGYSEDDDDGDYEKKGKIPRWAHFVVLGVIVAIVLYFVLQIVKWDHSSIELKESDEKNISAELQDFITYRSDEQKAGHKDDGEETILMVGNDAITHDLGDTGIAAQIEKASGAKCIAAGFPETTVARSANGNDPLDAFCFPSVIDAITSGDYSKLHEATSSVDNSSMFEDSVKTLEDVDMDKVDTLVIYYNAQDLLKGRIGRNPDNQFDEVTYNGALATGIKKIQEKYPYMRIIGMTVTFCYGFDKDGNVVAGDKLELGNGDLFQYYLGMMTVCSEAENPGVSVVDNYNGDISEENSKDLLVDNIHVNAECNKNIAEHFAEVFKNIVDTEKGTGEEGESEE